MYLGNGNLCDDSVLREGGAAHEMKYLVALAREPRGAVGHDAPALRGPHLAAKVGFGGPTELAVPTLGNVQGDNMVPCEGGKGILLLGRDLDSSLDVALKRGFFKYLLRNTIYFARAFKTLICFIFKRKKSIYL